MARPCGGLYGGGTVFRLNGGDSAGDRHRRRRPVERLGIDLRARSVPDRRRPRRRGRSRWRRAHQRPGAGRRHAPERPRSRATSPKARPTRSSIPDSSSANPGVLAGDGAAALPDGRRRDRPACRHRAADLARVDVEPAAIAGLGQRVVLDGDRVGCRGRRRPHDVVGRDRLRQPPRDRGGRAVDDVVLRRRHDDRRLRRCSTCCRTRRRRRSARRCATCGPGSAAD